MVRDGRLPENPVRFLANRNVQTDRRRVRRALNGAEFARLLEATVTQPDRGGLSGAWRARLDLFAAYSGLRRKVIAAGVGSSVDVSSDPATVTVEAAYSKRSKQVVISIKSDFAACVASWLEELGSDDRDRPLFPIKGARTGEWITKDLLAAGLTAVDDAGFRIDFHSLRQTFITNLSRSGASPKLAQSLARHGDINLTMNAYTTVGLADQRTAVESLPAAPKMPGVGPAARGASDQKLALKLALDQDVSGPQVSSGSNEDDRDDHEPDFLVRRENRGNSAVFSGDSKVPKVGLEPTRPLRTLDFESSASAGSATSAAAEVSFRRSENEVCCPNGGRRDQGGRAARS